MQDYKLLENLINELTEILEENRRLKLKNNFLEKELISQKELYLEIKDMADKL